MRYASFRAEIKKELEGPIASLLTTSLSKYTTNWKVPPKLQVVSVSTAKGITLGVVPIGPGALNWRRVSFGVAGHLIQVRKRSTFRRFKKYRPGLRLQRYRPATTPGGRWGGAGVKFGPVAYRRAVWWPGIFPRNFEERTYRETVARVRRMLENAARRGVRRAQREGTR